MKLWGIPTLYTMLSLVAGAVLPRLEHAFVPGLSHAMPVGVATAFLSSTASGILAFTGIVFSIAFVMVQFSAIAYSPRLVLWFAGRPELYHALGIFIATFTYSMATLLWTDRGGSGTVPLFSVFLVLVLLSASMIIFALLIRSLAKLQITEVLSFVGDEGRKVIAAQQRSASATSEAAHAPHGVGHGSRHVVYSGAPRSVTAVDFSRLLALAERHDAHIVVRAAVGDTVIEGSRMAGVDGHATGLADADIRAAFRLGPERTFEQDPKYALRLLVDIAIKALSPAINDPTTAVQAIDQIEDLVCRLAKSDLGSIWLRDGAGEPRVFVPMPSWEDYLGLAFDEIRQYGASSLQVMRRLRASMARLLEDCPDPRKQEAVRHYLVLLDQAVKHSELETTDRSAALEPDPQGLSFGREDLAEDSATPRPRRRRPKQRQPGAAAAMEGAPGAPAEK